MTASSPALLRVVASAVALGAWLGAALLLAAVVAPAAFATLPSRALAGAVVGRVLPVVFIGGIVAGALAAALALVGGPPTLARSRAACAGSLAACCAVAQLVIAPRIHRLREAIGPSIDALAADDARRVAFGRLHGMSVAWLGAGMLAAAAALVLCFVTVRARS
jgi:hypothetical protein